MARRRRSAHRRRGRGFQTACRFITVGAIVAAIVMALTLFFKVETIRVVGGERYSEAEILSASGLHTGSNLFLINKESVTNSIFQKLPYVRSTRIDRELPSTLVITVTECQAAGTVTGDGGTWAISAEGRIVERLDAGGGAATDSTDTADNAAGTADEPTPDAPGATEPQPTEPTANTDAASTAEAPAAEPLTAADPGAGDAADTDGGDGADAAPLAVAAIDGITAVKPAVGTTLTVESGQEEPLSELLGLLRALEGQGTLGQVQAIHLGDSACITMEYAGRFTVLIPWGADFDYKLRSLATVIAKLEDNETGTIDMTRANGEVHFLP